MYVLSPWLSHSDNNRLLFNTFFSVKIARKIDKINTKRKKVGKLIAREKKRKKEKKKKKRRKEKQLFNRRIVFLYYCSLPIFLEEIQTLVSYKGIMFLFFFFISIFLFFTRISERKRKKKKGNHFKRNVV